MGMFSSTSHGDVSSISYKNPFPPPPMKILPSTSHGDSFLPLAHPCPQFMGIPGGAGGAEGSALPWAPSQLRISLKCWHLVAARENNIPTEPKAAGAAVRNPWLFGIPMDGDGIWVGKERNWVRLSGERRDVETCACSSSGPPEDVVILQ